MAINVLFLCTGNSARSILAEAVLNAVGEARFDAFSAGSKPHGEVHPLALDLLAAEGHGTAGLRSKSWDEFAAPGAPPIGLVVTVCDSAAGETCPIWPRRPLTTHWSVPDPAAASGTEAERRAAFADAFRTLGHRIGTPVALPEPLGGPDAKARLDAIGRLAAGETLAAR